MTDLAARIAQLSPQERAELASLVRRSAAVAHPAPAAPEGITPVPRDGGHLPMSYTQERIWFLEQFNPGTPYHNMSGVARIPLRVDPDVFGDCIRDVVARHEILRTRFVMRDGEPAGIVQQSVTVPIRVLAELPAPERDRLFQDDAVRPFDLRVAPLLRVSIAPETGGDTLVQLTMHHIVSDGFSTSVFFRELGELYRLRLAGYGRVAAAAIPVRRRGGVGAPPRRQPSAGGVHPLLVGPPARRTAAAHLAGRPPATAPDDQPRRSPAG